jgi:heme/copper-type cytochrome/quinol oxidase subunit 2
MAKNKLLWAKVILVLLTLAVALSFYQVIFCAWMTAYSPANAGEWRRRFYIRLTTCLVVGILWITTAIWLIRQRRRGLSREEE